MNKNETPTPWKRFVNLLKLDKKDIYQICYYAIFAGLVNLSLPLGIQAIINLLQSAQVSTSWVVLVVVVTLGVAFAGVLQLMQLRIIEDIQQKIFTRSAFEFSYRFPKIKISELQNYYPPELANRFFDTITVQKSISKILIDIPAALLQILFGLILLSFYHSFFIIYGLLLIVFIYIVFKFTMRQGLETSLDESKHKYRVIHWIQEVARSIISFKLSGKTSHAMDKSDTLVDRYIDARESHFKILMLQFGQLIGFKVLVTAGLLVIGGMLVLNQQMNIGQFVAAEIIILLVINSVEKLILGLEIGYDMLTSLEKIGQVVDKELEPQPQSTEFKINGELRLQLEDIIFRYNKKEKPLLNELSLEIPQGSKIIIKGAQGSGRSTLLHLIAGLQEPESGNIYINNMSIDGISPNSYRGNIGQIIAEETPFEGTIKDNITFGSKNITEEDLKWAIENTGLTEFIKKQPKGWNTVIYPEGRQIPSTIAKKIVIARSIVKRPKLLILDKALDSFQEKEARRIIDFLTAPEHNWSLVVVTEDNYWSTKCTIQYNLENGKLFRF
ncbi:peptidase domain-containing ABC transporter [Robertkochia solimangrovi]|uniref:peptidase domain-containing ABC transporter n=1 Tax=Robertkochia solimangrovi TaxID=2213046 RepID=UPI0011804C6B|nr:ATP-binding cassette domain-containing protein [Robertkochia solimangrovi]TRZ41408.1 ABC transporter ATP-binding protein [Robertkochia solimangrovi]